jgi:cytoskeletal protein RodZ
MADKTKIHQSQIGALESGDVVSIKRLDSYILQYAKALGVPVEEIFGTRQCINHLNKELQDFVVNPENADILKRAWMEWELHRLNQKMAK